jgi:hypothetical protein
MNFTLNNHLTYSIGNRIFGTRETPYEKYKVQVGRIDQDYYKKSNWLQEQYRIADLVYQELGKDLIVMVSGGTDSEIVLRTLKHNGVTPRAVFIKFTNDYNIDELNAAQQIANDIGITLDIVDFDVIDFYKSGQALSLGAEVQCSKIAYLTVYHHVLKLQAPTIMGGAMILRRHVSNEAGKWYYDFSEETDGGSIRLSLKNNIPVVQEWFAYTPEAMGYYLNDPKIQWLINERFNYKLYSDHVKNEILWRLMPELIKKTKKHGYEKLSGFMAEAHNSINCSYMNRLEYSLDGIFVDDLRTQLFGDSDANC